MTVATRAKIGNNRVCKERTNGDNKTNGGVDLGETKGRVNWEDGERTEFGMSGEGLCAKCAKLNRVGEVGGAKSK